MNIVMRLIALIFLLIEPSFVAAELRWLCIAEETVNTNFFVEERDGEGFFEKQPHEFIWTIKLTGDNDKIEITRFKEDEPENLTDCLQVETSFQCHTPDNRNIMFYFDYINERFIYFQNAFAMNFAFKWESYMIGGYCSELD